MFVAFQYTTYSKAFCLFYTNTFFNPFLAYYMIGEPLKKWDFVGISVGFVGMILLI